MPEQMIKSRGALMLHGTCLMAAATLCAQDAIAAPAAQLAAHRAIYEMRLDKSATSSGIAELTGRMVFEFRGSACEGYTQSMRLVTQVTDRSGGNSLSDMRTSSWEEGSGRMFRFNATTLRNSKVSEVASGNAVVNPDDTLQIELTRPKKDELAVKEPVMFPVQHSLALLSAAKSGRRILQANIYDGSERGQKYFVTTSIVGKRIAPGDKVAKESPEPTRALNTLSSWPVSISYYDAGDKKDDGLPTYQMAFRFFENGVTRDLRIDYGDFSMNGKLADLEFFEEPGCEQPEN
ncbi:MAG: cell envelope integrity EipB family protein [Hyphomicrobiaceae bacterium]